MIISYKIFIRHNTGNV